MCRCTKVTIVTNYPPACCWFCSWDFLAGDDFFLGAATKAYAAEGSNWRRSYYMPTPADAAIVAFRKWLEKYSGGAIPFPQHMIVSGTAGDHIGFESIVGGLILGSIVGRYRWAVWGKAGIVRQHAQGQCV